MDTVTVAAVGNLLSAWTALEVLSPQPFSKKEDLANGKRQAIISIKTGKMLPWESGEIQPSKGKKLFYQVVIGSLNLQEVEHQFLSHYPDKHFEPRAAHRQAVMAVALVDHRGYLLKDFPSVALSSFAWGVPLALTGELSALGDWSNLESSLLKQLDDLLRRSDEEGNPQVIDKLLLEQAYHQLVERLGLPSTLVQEIYFAIQQEQPEDTKEPPPPLVLNSLYLDPYPLKVNDPQLIIGRLPVSLFDN